MRFAIAAIFSFSVLAGPALADCPQSVAKFQKLIDADLKTGFIAKDVYAKANGDLAGAGKLCKEGQDAAATAAVSAARSHYGYPSER